MTMMIELIADHPTVVGSYVLTLLSTGVHQEGTKPPRAVCHIQIHDVDPRQADQAAEAALDGGDRIPTDYEGADVYDQIVDEPG